MKYTLGALFIIFNLNVFSQLNNYEQFIDSSDLRKHISILASDSLEGRETGTNGQKLAANYIRELYKNYKLEPSCNNDYYQKFLFFNSIPKKVELIINNETIPNFSQIIYEGKLCTENVEKEIIFIGEGSDNELNGLNLENKALLLFTRKNLSKILSLKDSLKFHSILYVPVYSIDKFEQEFNSQFEFNKRAFNLFEKKPADFENFNIFDNSPLDINNEKEIIFNISPKYAEGILNMPIDSIKQTIVSNLKNNSCNNLKTLKCNSITYSIEIQINYQETENIIGMLQGNSENDKYLIITAHYDHLGKKGNEIFHGADDNASGVSAMLEIIQSLSIAKSSGYSIPFNIIFIATTGEEQGLWGSLYYTTHPIYPLDKTIANINIDMLGRTDADNNYQDNYLYIIQAAEVTNKISKYFKSNSDLKIILKNQTLSNFEIRASDQYSFLLQNIPNVFITNGTHMDYHKTTDTENNIDYSLLEKRTKLILEGIFEIAKEY